MVTRMGFSDKLGDVDLDSMYNRLSSETKKQIEGEVRRLVNEARTRANKLLTERRDELDILAKALVEYEVLNADEIRRVLKGEKLPNKLSSTPRTPIKVPELKPLVKAKDVPVRMTVVEEKSEDAE
jgi:ATP-dependent metalloprotease